MKEKKIACLSEKGCNGSLHLKRTEYTIRLKDRAATIPDVEVWECDRCGERFYPYETSRKIDVYKEYSGRLMLRLEPEIHWKLTKIAKKHHRSINQEINYLLESGIQGAA